MIHVAIIKAVLALVPASTVLAGSAVFFCQDKGAASVLQLIGAGCLGHGFRAGIVLSCVRMATVNLDWLRVRSQ